MIIEIFISVTFLPVGTMLTTFRFSQAWSRGKNAKPPMPGFLCGLHKVCSHDLSTRVERLSRSKPHMYALRTYF